MKSLPFEQMEKIEGGRLTPSCYAGIGLAVASTIALGFATGGFWFAFASVHAGWIVTAMGCAGK